ncbi:MAG: M28 family peptidase [Acidobacteriota bacterium]|nr:M28 family peptidase [Acidobacteriota bacterium]
MRVKHSSNFSPLPRKDDFVNHLFSVTEDELINIVDEISIPRHFRFNAENNKYVANWIFSQLASFGYETHFQGSFSNIVAFKPNIKSSVILIGAHYDSVPSCPGADDNASAIASMMVCAKAVSQFAPNIPVCFVAFNCEEDGLVGSRDFVSSYLTERSLKINLVHILEMVGYATEEPNSRTLPAGLPIKIPKVGNFLGIMGNRDSLGAVDNVLNLAKSYLPDFPVIGLKLYLGAEKLIPDLGRSDHLPFWEKRIPALMWTDTAEFRNPNYHKLSDTPNTLNYTFLKNVTQLLLLQILNASAHF